MIVVAGEGLIDLIIDADATVRAVPGGGPYNTARTIARLGQPIGFLGRVGTDRFGRMLLAGLDGDAADLRYVVATDAPTTLAVAELDATGVASYRFYLDGTSAAGLTTAEAFRALSESLQCLHVGTLGLVMEPIASSLEQLIAGVGQAVLVMVDPNCRPIATRDPARYRARIERLLPRADVVKVSVDDLTFLQPGCDALTGADRILQGGTAVVLLTNGGESVTILTASGHRVLPVAPVDVVDSVGSGDAFGGAFLAWWSSHALGRSDLADVDLVAQAAGFAIKVASRTCERVGADPPTLSELGGWG